MTFHRAVTPIVLAVAVCSVSLAQDGDGVQRIFKLKNGRRIVGQLIEQTEDTYVVGSANGKTTIPRSLVEKIEPDAPAPKPFLEPDPKPAPQPVAAPREIPKAKDPEVQPKPSDSPHGLPTPTAESLKKTKAALASVEKLTADVPEEDRERTRARIVGELETALPIEDLVAVLAEYMGVNAPTPEQKLAYELAQKKGAAVRPLLLRAFEQWNPTEGRPVYVLRMLQRLGADTDGAVERALATKLAALLSGGYTPTELVPLYSELGTKRSLPRLFELLLLSDPDLDAGGGLKDIARAILVRESDPDAALQPLLAKVNISGRTPADLYRLRHVLDLVSLSKGPPAIEKLTYDAFTTIDRALHDDANDPLAQACHASLVNAAAAIGTDHFRSFLFEILERQVAEVRLTTIRAFGTMKTQAGVPNSLLRDLVEQLAREGTWTQEETKALNASLQALTGETLGTVDAWRRYIDKRKE